MECFSFFCMMFVTFSLKFPQPDPDSETILHTSIAYILEGPQLLLYILLEESKNIPRPILITTQPKMSYEASI